MIEISCAELYFLIFKLVKPTQTFVYRSKNVTMLTSPIFQQPKYQAYHKQYETIDRPENDIK
jgi:hypothetical protein